MSYELTADVESAPAFAMESTARADEPAVKVVAPPTPAPSRLQPPIEMSKGHGLLTRIWMTLFGGSAEPQKAASPTRPSSSSKRHGNRHDSTGRSRGDGAESRRRGNATRRGESHPGRGSSHGDNRRRRGARPTPAEPETSSEHLDARNEDTTVSSGEGRSRSARRGSRRGRRGGGRNRGRESTRAVADGTESTDTVLPTAPGSPNETASPAEVEPSASVPTGKTRSRPDARAATESNGSGDEKKAGTVAPTIPDSLPESAHESVAPDSVTRPPPQEPRPRNASNTRPDPDTASPRESTPASDVDAQPRRAAITERSAEPPAGD